uniref:Importin-alpha, putative n=1 Tax=Theileria annulata TaxID=5874 RepID=A0A3B0N1A7_THEAN
MMSESNFTRTIITLCRQSLSGDKLSIKSADDQMSLLVKSDSSETDLKILLIFKIILAPQAISSIENTLTDDELSGLKYATADVQLWSSIFIKNYIKANFDTSESFGGVSDSIKNIIKSFLIISTLNSESLGIPKPVASQLESALFLISERYFPESLEQVLLFIDYCHLSDVNHIVLLETLSSRLQNELNSRSNKNILTPNTGLSSSLNHPLTDSQSNLEINYAQYLLGHLKNYSNILQSIFSYNKILTTNNVADISRSYFEFFNRLVEGVKNMCNLCKGVGLKDLEMSKFIQSTSFLFTQSTLTTHTTNPLTKTNDVSCSPGDSLFYFDDRKQFTDINLFQHGINLPELGSNQHNVHLLISPSLFLNEMSYNKSYFKNKLSSFRLFTKFMKKYKTRQYDEDTLTELKIVLTLSDTHLLYLFKYSMLKFTEYYTFYTSQKNTFSFNCLVPAILDVFEFIRHVTKIFCYVHSIDLPECFEDNAQLYFSGLINLIHFNDQFITEKDSLGTLMSLKVTIMKLFRYYAERYQEVFHPFVFTCIEDVVKLCRGIHQDSSYDKLCCSALDFLSSCSSTHWCASHQGSARNNPFMNNSFLAEIIQNIIVPNIGFRECDLILLDDCPIEFVQRELDSNNCSSRRFSSITFLKKLVSGYGQVCQQIINQVAKSVASNHDYKLKELYLQLIICINFKDSSGDFNVITYFTEYLKNEFVMLSQNPLTREKMLIILAIIKYIYTFKNLLPESELASIVPYLVLYLRNTHEAVRCFASEALYRLLGKLRLHKDTLKTCLLQGLEHLLTMMRSCGRAGNEFYAKCTMRILIYLREDIRESGMVMIDIVINMIKSVSDNPVNPSYNHLLFECLCILLRIHLQTQVYSVTTTLEKIEEALIPTLGLIIQQEMHPFIPYSLQVLSIMLKYASKPSTTYVQLLNHLVCIDTWKVSIANAQGNIKLLVCYFEKHKLFENEIMTNMEKMLNIFHFCLNHKRLSKYSLDLINGIVRYLPLNYYINFLKSIITVLLTYIHNNKSGETLTDVVTSISYITLQLHLQKYAHSLVDILESIQSGISSNFVQFIYLPNAKKASSLEAKKVHAIAVSKIATCDQMKANSELFRLMMEFLAELISGENMTLDSPKDDLLNIGSVSELGSLCNMDNINYGDFNFDVSYVKLHSVEEDKNKLLDRSLGVEEVIRGILTPVGPLIKASASMSNSLNVLMPFIA